MKSPTACQPERIEHFLRQELSAEEQALFERHLDDCAACRSALESAAAAADVWQTAKSSLSEIELHQVERPSHDDPANDPEERVEPLLRILAPTDDPRMLGRIGNYEIVGLIGYGGMGVVFKGLDPALNRYVAIKVLAPHLSASGSARQRFAREAQAAAAVMHENVIAIHGVSEHAGMPYLVMPYIRGESLQKRLDQKGSLTVMEVLRVARQVAAGLAAAHAQGLVHRDIKPANILLEDGVERLKITDFGLARAADDASMTRSGVIAGTPQYMSPEQATGEAIDARSDLFSLGSMIYAMTTGRPPFRAETSYGILRRITDTEPRPIREINPEAPPWLAKIVARLHAKASAARFSSAEEVAELCEQCLAHLQQPTIAPLPDFCHESKTRMTIRWRKAFAVTAVLSLLTVSIWSLWPNHNEVSRQPIASQAANVDAPENPAEPTAEVNRAKSLSPELLQWDGLSTKMNSLQADLDRLSADLPPAPTIAEPDEPESIESPSSQSDADVLEPFSPPEEKP